MNLRFRHCHWVALLAAALSAGAHADCVDGVREPTAAEVEFAKRARGALIAGLPGAIAPISRSGRPGDPDERVSLGFCRGTPVGAFTPQEAGRYSYEFTREEAAQRAAERRRLQQQVEDIERLPPDKEAQRKALEEQMRAAYAAAPRRSRSDPPLPPDQQVLADRQNAEGRRLEDAMRKVESDHRASVKPQTDPLRARADQLQQGPQQFDVRLQMNAERFPSAGEAMLLTFGKPSPKRSATLRAENIVVSVTGPDGPARAALVKLIDTAYLQSLVGEPLPDLAASKARIERVNAQASGAQPLAIAPTATSGSAAPAAAATAATASPIAPAAPTAAPPAAAARSSGGAPCPPAASAQAGGDAARTGSQVGAEVGGAALGGGWGRNVGSAVSGVLGAIGGAAKKTEPAAPADCSR